MQRRDLLKMAGTGMAMAAAPLSASAIPLGPGQLSGRESPSDSPAPPLDAGFNVRAYGAKGDGVAADSPAINRAIEAAAAAGGGTVIFPLGKLPELFDPLEE